MVDIPFIHFCYYVGKNAWPSASGVCTDNTRRVSALEVRWKLAMLYLWLELAYTQALPSGYFSHLSIRSVSGAVDPLRAQSIVQAFLKDPSIQLGSKPTQDDRNWEEITRPNKPPFWEHADWIDRAWIYKQ